MNNIRKELSNIMEERLESENLVSRALRSVTQLDAIELKIEGVAENDAIKNVMNNRLEAMDIIGSSLAKLADLERRELEVIKKLAEQEKRTIDIAKFMNGEEVEV